MTYEPISLRAKFDLLQEAWTPKIVAELNDYTFKVVQLQGDFVWHSHAETDEAFLVIEGQMRIDFRDGSVDLKAGELFVVPKGTEHKPFAEQEARVLLIEPRGVVNTGDQPGGRTKAGDAWI